MIFKRDLTIEYARRCIESDPRIGRGGRTVSTAYVIAQWLQYQTRKFKEMALIGTVVLYGCFVCVYMYFAFYGVLSKTYICNSNFTLNTLLSTYGQLNLHEHKRTRV